jgi:prevent-host-death family protein
MRASDVKPITYMKTHSTELIATVNKKRSPVVITQNGSPRAVLMDMRSYERIQDALIMLKLIARSEEDFQNGRWLSQAQLGRQLRETLGD